MNKFLLVLLLFISSIFPKAYSYKLEGAVLYNVNIAREISFKKVSEQIDTTCYKEFQTDRNYLRNRKAIANNKYKVKNRIITSYSDNTYSIRYTNFLNPCFYYDSTGNLIAFGFLEGDVYPKKYLTYNKDGKLLDISLYISGTEQYIFTVDRNLQAHWIGNNCYDEKGELVMTRK